MSSLWSCVINGKTCVYWCMLLPCNCGWWTKAVSWWLFNMWVIMWEWCNGYLCHPDKVLFSFYFPLICITSFRPLCLYGQVTLHMTVNRPFLNILCATALWKVFRNHNCYEHATSWYGLKHTIKTLPVGRDLWNFPQNEKNNPVYHLPNFCLFIGLFLGQYIFNIFNSVLFFTLRASL